MKKILSLILISTFALTLISCKSNTKLNSSKNDRVTNVTTSEAHKLISSKKNLVILDVRTNEEYKSGHIKNSILIPSTELDLNIEQISKFKENPVLVYCRTGRRSKDAVDILVKNGFKEIYHMNQGISAWKYDLEQ